VLGELPPKTEYTCWIELEGPGFAKRVYGFWDGGRTFKVRFVATAPGDWRWRSASNQPDDTGLNGGTGALRAVADDHQAALSIGIPLNRIWVIVWCVAGVVALVAGIIWGSKLGVQFSLATVAMRALPVVILGGLTSVPGAILGGLIIGVGEKLSEVYIGPMVGGGIEIWFAYMLALVFLLFRPQGLFGEKIIDRV